MIEPILKDDAFLQDVRAPRADVLSIWWLGQSGFLIKSGGCHVLLDPYLSDSLTEKYAGTNKPHVRMTARVIAPERLDFISVVTSSHSHTDHLDTATLMPLVRVNPKLTVVFPQAARATVVQRTGLADDSTRLIGLDEGSSACVGDIEFHAIPSAHETLERDSAGRSLYLGYVVKIGRWTVYHSGDTVRYEGMAQRIAQWPIDVALLPINGRAPERAVAGNLDGAESAELAKAIGARLVIPCHYDMFAFNTAAPDGFVTRCRELGQPCRVLRNGERVDVG